MAPVTVAVTLLGIWMSQKGDRQRRIESDRRIHSAMFGYEEGATKVPGIYDIVVGDGNGGSLSAIAQGARTAANNAVLTASETKKLVEAHVIRDDERWEEVATSLSTLSSGQANLSGIVTEHVADDRAVWLEMGTALGTLTSGQAEAASRAESVAEALRLDTAAKAAQATKRAPAKRTAPAKMAAKKKGRS